MMVGPDPEEEGSFYVESDDPDFMPIVLDNEWDTAMLLVSCVVANRLAPNGRLIQESTHG
jgi:hypothetical protein